MRSTLIPVLLAILLSVTLCACSGSNSPAAPPVNGDNDIASALTGNLHESDSQEAGHYLWAYYHVFVDQQANEVKIVPVREITGHWNVLLWLEQGPCTDCFNLVNLIPSGTGTLLADIQIIHPFTQKNLTGFDVRGIAMFDASLVFPVSGLTYSDRILGDGELVNADGYTTLYNYTTAGAGPNGLEGYIKGNLATVQPPNALLNGYKRHITNDSENTRNAFYSGDAVTVTYEIDMPDGPFVFGYAVDACWVMATNKPVKDPMNDFPPEANCPEPWQLSVSDAGPGLTDQGDSTKVIVDVYDWSGKNSHSSPMLECPEVFAGTLSAGWTEDGVGYSRYQVSVVNEELAPVGEYTCLIGVEDNENSTAPEWLDLTAYQMLSLQVVEHENLLPVAKAGAEPNPQLVGAEVHFFDDGSYDPDGGDIVLYEWDWDNDGVFDEGGAEAYHSWDVPGVYFVQLRVTDDEATTDELDEPLTVVITAGEGWVYTWTEGSTNWLDEVASDGNGNVYVCGMETSGSPKGLVSKVDVDGNHQWTKRLEGENLSHFDGVACDSVGNVYVAGYFTGVQDLDPGSGEDLHEAVGSTDILLIKLDSDGEYIWGHSWGGDLSGTSYWYERGHGVACDESGGVYVTGIFRGICDFDPGPELEEYTSNGYEDGGFDAFLSKFDSTGEFQWARTWGSPLMGDTGFADAGETAFGVAVDSIGDVYVTGGFYGTVDFDPGAGVVEFTSGGPYGDAYLLKWSLSGDFIWVNVWDAIGFSYFPIGMAQMWGGSYVTVDNHDNVYVTGSYEGPTDFDPGPGVDEYDGFGTSVSKFTPAGEYTWADVWQGSNIFQVAGMAVATDSSENAYVTGFFAETVDFDPGPGIDERTPIGWRDSFLCKLDSNGDYLWALSWGASGLGDHVEGWGVTTDEDDNSYMVGLFDGTVDFDPGPEVHNEVSDGFGSYLLKLLPDGTW